MADEKRKSGLDKRQRGIKVGAGLEEARYNVEFIDFLQRWGPTVMLVIAAAALAFWGMQRWRESRESKQGIAFGDLDQAMYAPQGLDVNPEVLVRIAEDNAGQGAVPLLARLKAAEQWRESAMKGYRPGSLDPKTRQVASQDDYLTPEGKKELLDKARQQYQLVVDQSAGNVAKATFTLTGYMGLASIAESQGRIEEAKAAFAKAQELAEKAHFPEYAALAGERLKTVEKYATPVALVPESMVMSWDKPRVSVPLGPGPTLVPGGSDNPLAPGVGASEPFKLEPLNLSMPGTVT
ncbi:MAG: hypothetical protein K2Q09_08025, partial [Phycisphaerales bacterium]|nr:hypothetical protein [Phycisphaerales bacterium]